MNIVRDSTEEIPTGRKPHETSSTELVFVSAKARVGWCVGWLVCWSVGVLVGRSSCGRSVGRLVALTIHI